MGLSAGTWQTARLLVAILVIWCLVTLFSLYIEEKECEELVDTSTLEVTSKKSSEILPGLSDDDKHKALHGENAQSSENGLEMVASKDTWNDIRIGVDYICCYRDPSDMDNNIGRPFPMNDYIKDVWFNYMKVPTINIQHTKPVPVTALSDNHYPEHKQRIHSFLDKNPGVKVVVYDLGLSKENLKELKSNKFIVKKFDFDRYPEHVKNLDNFAWKILVWAEMLEHYGALTYFDTSIEWSEPLQPKIKEMQSTDSCYQSVIKETGHTIAYGVHPMMYTFFPSNVTTHMYPYNMMKMAGGVVIFNTKECKDDLLRWAVLCALNPECIAPIGARKQCPPGTNKYQPHICHRYDQALMSILLANRYGVREEDQKKYHSTQILAKPNRI